MNELTKLKKDSWYGISKNWKFLLIFLETTSYLYSDGKFYEI